MTCEIYQNVKKKLFQKNFKGENPKAFYLPKSKFLKFS